MTTAHAQSSHPQHLSAHPAHLVSHTPHPDRVRGLASDGVQVIADCQKVCPQFVSVGGACQLAPLTGEIQNVVVSSSVHAHNMQKEPVKCLSPKMTELFHRAAPAPEVNP